MGSYKDKLIRWNLRALIHGSIIAAIIISIYLFVWEDISQTGFEDIYIPFFFCLTISFITTNLIYVIRENSLIRLQPRWIQTSLSYVALLSGMLLARWIFLSIAHLPENRLYTEALNNLRFTTTLTLLFGTGLYINLLREENYTLKLQEKKLELTQLRELKMKAVLEALQAKVNPHFLYNSLNSIACLIHEDPDRAEEMIIRLSRFFRYSINTKHQNFSTVKEEIEIVRTYIHIEKMRFSNSLDFEVQVEPTLANELIPRFIIQPFVENAIKHGLSKTGQDFEVKITILEKNHKIAISIFDNGPLFPEKLEVGYGIQSAYDKLNLLYPGNYLLCFINETRKKVEIHIPKQKQYAATAT